MYEYKFKLVARCPNDTSVNIYDVTIKNKTMVQVEEFLSLQNDYYLRDIYQEDIFDQLKDRYDVLKIVGTHQGVEVITQ